MGQSWKRDDAGPQGPRDAFSFELDGVNLLPGANDEPLVRVIAALVNTVADLAIGGERAGQLSLDDVHLELCLWRTTGTELEASVIDLGKPPRRLRPPVRLDLTELRDAATKCARAFLRDEQVRQTVSSAELGSIEARLSALDATVLKELSPREKSAWSATRAPGDGGLGFALIDDDARTLAFTRKTRAALPPLLCGGRLTLPSGESVEGLPFLGLVGLAREAAPGRVTLGGSTVPARAVFEAGLDACVVLRERNPALAANPYVEALQVRCTDGLAQLRPPTPDTTSPAPSAPAREASSTPLAAPGALRRVRLAPKWTRQVALGEEGGRLLLGRGLVVVASPHAAHGFSPRGVTRFRRLSTRGVAAATTGDVLLATPERIFAYPGSSTGARWMRDHDGATVGPELLEIGTPQGQSWVTPLGTRGVAGFEPTTGRELWRLDPPRTQRSFISALGARVLLATDSGSLYGVDAADGQVRFRVKASMPCAGPAIAVGNRAIAVLNRGEHTAIFVCDALATGDATPAGAIVWTRELLLSQPTQPVVSRGRTFVGGGREGRSLVVCLGPRGQLLWERPVPCDARRMSLVSWDGGVIAGDARGVCARLLPDGQPDWVLGGAGDELNHRIPLSIHRRLVIVPGPSLRIVDPPTGRVLTELDAGPRLADVIADRRLNLYVYKEPGELEAWAPSSLLSVV